MASTLATALLPIVLTLLLGFFAGWHHDFSADQAPILNRMVMLYALPLSLFAGMVTVSRSSLVSDLPMAGMVAGTMVVAFVVVVVVTRVVLHRDLGEAALWGLAIGGPAVPFVGTPVLGTLLGSAQATVPIAVASLTMNLVQVPAALVMLSVAHSASTRARASAPASASPAPAAARGTAGAPKPAAGAGGHVLAALREPVVWAPLAALVLVLAGWSLPHAVTSSLALLGQATGGVALFASGLVLYAQRVSLTAPVGWAVACRNLVIPALVLGLTALLGFSHENREASVLAMAIPTASICVILAVQYHRAERQMASVLFISTVASVATMAGFIALTR
ncbi:AEC family transporter [Luteimicrobium xylanilyticum]|uniref:Putative transporter YfdV n=1 Tax=Luteimicrobium xylanilyticum TaxID=1133546 RepID=A0A5P9QDJ0_9MICO|nr:AEC family transporter [Luteimicrobium xylanilyticum]QFU99534.1 putative transporter YfdV [Luteimicrobium xylanilyticum]